MKNLDHSNSAFREEQGARRRDAGGRLAHPPTSICPFRHLDGLEAARYLFTTWFRSLSDLIKAESTKARPIDPRRLTPSNPQSAIRSRVERDRLPKAARRVGAAATSNPQFGRSDQIKAGVQCVHSTEVPLHAAVAAIASAGLSVAGAQGLSGLIKVESTNARPINPRRPTPPNPQSPIPPIRPNQAKMRNRLEKVVARRRLAARPPANLRFSLPPPRGTLSLPLRFWPNPGFSDQIKAEVDWGRTRFPNITARKAQKSSSRPMGKNRQSAEANGKVLAAGKETAEQEANGKVLAAGKETAEKEANGKVLAAGPGAEQDRQPKAARRVRAAARAGWNEPRRDSLCGAQPARVHAEACSKQTPGGSSKGGSGSDHQSNSRANPHSADPTK